jgi:predicted membrane protein
MKTAMIQIVLGIGENLPIHKTLGGITIMLFILLLVATFSRVEAQRGNTIQVIERIIMALVILLVIFGVAALVYTIAYVHQK